VRCHGDIENVESSGYSKSNNPLELLFSLKWRQPVVSGDVQELQVSRRENEMENSCSDIGEVHRVNELQDCFVQSMEK